MLWNFFLHGGRKVAPGRTDTCEQARVAADVVQAEEDHDHSGDFPRSLEQAQVEHSALSDGVWEQWRTHTARRLGLGQLSAAAVALVPRLPSPQPLDFKFPNRKG